MCVPLPGLMTHSASAPAESSDDHKTNKAVQEVFAKAALDTGPAALHGVNHEDIALLLDPQIIGMLKQELRNCQQALNQAESDLFKTMQLQALNALKTGEDAVIELLKVPEFEAGVDKNLLLIGSCQKGWTRAVQELLKRDDVDPSAGDTRHGAIKIAYHCGYEEIVQLFLDDERVNPAQIQTYEEWLKQDTPE